MELSDSEPVELTGVFVEYVIFPYVFVSDPCRRDSPWSVLPVYAPSFIINEHFSLNITGAMATVENNRIVIADDVEIYTDSAYQAFLVPVPFGGQQWPYLADAETTASIMSGIPAVPNSGEMAMSMELLTLQQGSIAAARLDGGTVTLSGKVVTAAFTGFFYVQEPVTGGQGIKVVPPQGTQVLCGYVVDIEGSVVGGPTAAECYVNATSVTQVSARKIPKPVGLSQVSAAAGEFGEQQALYTRPGYVGFGLNAVGTRARVFGRVTWKSTDGACCFIDDGSGLTCNYDGSTRTGIRLISSTSCPLSYQVDDQVQGITGILGAEMVDDVPVPVVRVPCDDDGCVIYVRPDGNNNNSGLSWTDAKATMQAGIDAADSGMEVWVAAGTYEENIELADGVAVYGGFSGSECCREQRNWSTNVTTIDGGGIGSVVTANLGVTSSARIDGFTITNWV